MNYQKIYNSLIEKAKNKVNIDYTEKHHITPKCMGGNDKKENIIRLSYREHFLAHWLLCKIYPKNYKLKAAFAKMLETTKNNKRTVSSFQYTIVKKNLKDLKYPWLKGVKSSGSWKKGNIPWNKGISTGPMPEENKTKISHTLKKKYKNIQHHLKGKPSWNTGLKTGIVPWNKGKNERRIICNVCGYNANPGNFKRWHSPNCTNFAADRYTTLPGTMKTVQL